MKKRLSIFWSIILIVLPLVVLIDILAIFSTYNYISGITYEHYKEDIMNAAGVADELLHDQDLKNTENGKLCSKELDTLCEKLNLPYIYVIEIDKNTNTIKYLCIGTGEGASETFKEQRHEGDIIKVEMSKYYLSALSGNYEDNVEHIDNEFDNTLTCYIQRTGKNSKNELIAAEISVESIIDAITHDFMIITILTILLTSLIVITFAVIVHKRVQKPAHLISNKMSSFVNDRQNGYEKLNIKGSREFTEMAESFNLMTEEIDRYIKKESEINRQNAELHIAREIQKGLLEPPKIEYSSGRISACMLPAKDVGGDLYDYIELDDGRICVLIADVSGKGFSAALFMSRAITLLHQYAQAYMSPGRILQEYNNHLADHNPNMLFITTFVAIYDPETDKITYANAGHNPPFIISDNLIKLDKESGMAAGIFKDETYVEHTADIKEGDSLFLYTDGVTEAKNIEGGLFTDKALEEILTSLSVSDREEPVSPVLNRLETFTDNVNQTDDITMLSLNICRHTCNRLILETKTENLSEIFKTINSLKLSDETTNQLRFMAEEMFVNICSYAYQDRVKTAEVIIQSNKKFAEITFIDSGLPFDPTSDIPDMEKYDIDNRIGGLGRFLTFSIADEYDYKRSADKNVLKIRKKLS